MAVIKNESGKVSKTKVGSWLLGVAGAIEAAAVVPGLPAQYVPWLHASAIFIGSIGTLLGGVGLRDALGKK